MPPDIYTPIRKPWGTSTLCYRDEVIEVVKIVVLPGGFCSRHLHRRKSNQFIVVKGELEIVSRVSVTTGGVCVESDDKILLQANGIYGLTISAGIQHRFCSPRWGQFDDKGGSTGGAVAYEIYAASPGEKIDPEDIERFDEGGRE